MEKRATAIVTNSLVGIDIRRDACEDEVELYTVFVGPAVTVTTPGADVAACEDIVTVAAAVKPQ